MKVKWPPSTFHNHRSARVVLLPCLSSLVSNEYTCSFAEHYLVFFSFDSLFFLAANEALARVASLGLLPNMILYLMGTYRLHLAQATQILLWSHATSNFTPVVGAFIADSYLGRFLAVGLGSAITFLVLFFLYFFFVFLLESFNFRVCFLLLPFELFNMRAMNLSEGGRFLR